MKKVRACLGISIALISASVFAGDIPRPVGFVNDFADIIPADVKNRLEEKLRQYEKQTSIEVAVVTISSLNGETVEDYTIQLARSWGVGKKQKNNGVVILVAPNERKMRIEVGYGVEPYLTDGQAGEIIRNDMIPQFKRGDMVAGIVAGANSVLEHLGARTLADREAEQKALEKKRQLERERAAVQAAKTTRMLIIMAVIGAVLLGIGYLIFYSIRKQQKIKEAPKLLDSLPNEVKRTEEMISDPDISSDPRQALKEAKAKLTSAEILATRKSPDWLAIATLCASVSKLLSDAEEGVRNEKDEIAETQRDLKRLPNAIARAAKKATHKSVRKSTRNRIASAAKKYREAKNRARGNPINWLVVGALVVAAYELLEDAEDRVESDRDDYSYSSPSYSGSSYSSSSSSSSDSFSSSSGGGSSFGGGSFGGGGASGSW